MTFLFDYSPFPGQGAHSPSSRICIVSLRVLSLDLFAAVLALASPHFKFVFPYFYAKIPMDSSFPLCSKTLLFSFLVECEAIENRRQLTSLRQTFFSWINLSLNAVGSNSMWSWNFPVIVWNLEELSLWYSLAVCSYFGLTWVNSSNVDIKMAGPVGNLDLWSCWKELKILAPSYLSILPTLLVLTFSFLQLLASPRNLQMRYIL